MLRKTFLIKENNMKIKSFIKNHKIISVIIIIILLWFLIFPIKNQFANTVFYIHGINLFSEDRYFRILDNGRIVRTRRVIDFDSDPNLRAYHFAMCTQFLYGRNNINTGARRSCRINELSLEETDFKYAEEILVFLTNFNDPFWSVIVYIIYDTYFISITPHLGCYAPFLHDHLCRSPNYIYQFNPNTNEFNRLGVLRNIVIRDIKSNQ